MVTPLEENRKSLLLFSSSHPLEPMASFHTQLRCSRPSQVQTSFPAQTTLASATATVTTPSSLTSTSIQSSPAMTPDTTGVTTCASSMQASPDAFRGRDLELFPPTPLHLPESVLARKTSTSSLGHTSAPSITLPDTHTKDERERKGVLRRFSSRRKHTISRRQSSVAPRDRDSSVGPAVLRRRSDSNNTAPPDLAPAVSSDSEEDIYLDNRTDDSVFGSGYQSPARLDGCGSATASISGSMTSSTLFCGPTIDNSLHKGTLVEKVKSKQKAKSITLILEEEPGKITWTHNRRQKSIYIDDIREIRSGSDTRQSRLDYGLSDDVYAERFFSILYAKGDNKTKDKMLHIICGDSQTCMNWTQTLEALSKHREGRMASLAAFNEKALKDYWQREMGKQYGDPDVDEEVDLEGVERICRDLHINADPSQVRAKFRVADSNDTGRLSFGEFTQFTSLMRQRDDLKGLFRLVCDENGPLKTQFFTLEQFLSFLKDIQHEDVDSNRPYWESVFSRFARRASSNEVEQLEGGADLDLIINAEALASFLTSAYSPPMIQPPAGYELDRPVNEYFISSSHNTYLIGRQVAAQSSVEGYIAALVRGCRCVEVDCWDGSDGLPIVKHGYALTTSISFKEVMATINKYAFVQTHFPLWISLEVHCNPTQQEIMANMIKEAFGAKLVTEPLDPTSEKLPSPSQLKDRILIKVKKPGETHTNGEPTGRRRGNSFSSNSASSPYIRPVFLDGPVPSFPNSPHLSPSFSARGSTSRRRVKTITEGVHEEFTSAGSDSDTLSEPSPPKKSSSVKIVKALGELGVYSQGIKFNSTLDGPGGKAPNHIYSLKETSFNQFCQRSKENKRAIFRHNMRYFMRVYPDQTRIRSDNFDPLIYWRRGVQMCALNWQTNDLPMQLNAAMFASGTDRSGYVLKPSELREIQVVPNMSEDLVTKRPRKQVKFTIDVISAQQLFRPMNLPANRTFNPYVEVEIYHANDKRDKKESRSSVMAPVETLRACTGVVRENGFNPVFNRKCQFVVTTKFPELVFIRWTIRLSQDGASPNSIGDKTPPIASFTAKLFGLNQGYRTLPLYDLNGDKYLFSTLFCRIQVEEPSNIYLPCRNGNLEPSVNVLKSIGRSVFSRSNTISKNGESLL